MTQYSNNKLLKTKPILRNFFTPIAVTVCQVLSTTRNLFLSVFLLDENMRKLGCYSKERLTVIQNLYYFAIVMNSTRTRWLTCENDFC